MNPEESKLDREAARKRIAEQPNMMTDENKTPEETPETPETKETE